MTAPADEAALAARLSIEPHHLALVRQILARLLPGREVWAFGSRAGGGAHPPKPWSDLDLAVIGAHALTLDEQAALAEAFSESDLPWRVDVVDWTTLDEAFRARIAAARLLLLSGSQRLCCTNPRTDALTPTPDGLMPRHPLARSAAGRSD